MRLIDAPSITSGSYWICRSVFCRDLAPTDIYAKVLCVKGDDIHFIRKTNYGFTDLSPCHMKAEEFLSYYMRLEDA